VNGPAVAALETAVYVIPTDAPEADGTLAWDKTGHCAPNLHAHVGAALPNLRHVEYFHDHQRIERLFFDGVLDPAGGAMRPGLDRPGHGLVLKEADTERYRQG
jgi:L-alanine-DL-glutamate epimerase-like enolase superfamily enzyme